MTRERSAVTLIGDVVASRAVSDRALLHQELTAAVAAINDEFQPVSALRPTVGDEYQGRFATVGAALQAALRLRLRLHPGFEVRHGAGCGPVSVLSEEPLVEDGPGWWAARAAIEAVHTAETRAASRGLRTAYVRAAEGDGPDPAAVNAALVARDQLLAGVAADSLSVLSGMLQGVSQRQIADELGVSASAVSQRIRRDGLTAVVRVDELFEQLESAR